VLSGAWKGLQIVGSPSRLVAHAVRFDGGIRGQSNGLSWMVEGSRIPGLAGQHVQLGVGRWL